MSAAEKPWYRELTRYHWIVLIICSGGWALDCLDQQIFILARKPAITQLLGLTPGDPQIDKYGGYATSLLLLGWATGGIVFGIMGDRLGRVKTMVWTILFYALFTGLSAASRAFWDFAVYRFLMGLGVGGQFALSVALVAETMPDRARPYALGSIQALSTVGNISAALINMLCGHLEQTQVIYSAWRWMFAIGGLPVLLIIAVVTCLKEPERWQNAVGHGAPRKSGPLRELFASPLWRRRAILGMILASAGVMGLWSIGFFTPDLNRSVFGKTYDLQHPVAERGPQIAPPEAPQTPEQIARRTDRDGYLTWWSGITALLFNIGAFFGIYAGCALTARIGRRAAFLVAFPAAMASTGMTFMLMRTASDVFWMVPLMGFCQLAVMGLYTVYFPELFPTRLRSTGVSLCYNSARFVACLGPSALGLLTSEVFTPARGFTEPMRYAGLTMCSVFMIGLLVLPFAPETKGQPLPE